LREIDRVGRSEYPGLPDPRTLRRIIRNRRLRDELIASGLFADPAWDMLLDLTAAQIEQRRVSVSSLCVASGVPSTTALRWIRVMEDNALIAREEDTIDRRRSYVTLTDRAVRAMSRYFAETGTSADWQY
jgi:DNA-binding MarR family transcriptional regulator